MTELERCQNELLITRLKYDDANNRLQIAIKAIERLTCSNHYACFYFNRPGNPYGDFVIAPDGRIYTQREAEAYQLDLLLALPDGVD